MSKLKANEITADKWTNPNGTENYKCRAWVNFDGTGTVAIRGAGNVSSITDIGTGDYSVNFTTALDNANYAVCGSVGNDDPLLATTAASVRTRGALTTTAVRVVTGNHYVNSSPTYYDMKYVSVAVFG